MFEVVNFRKVLINQGIKWECWMFLQNIKIRYVALIMTWKMFYSDWELASPNTSDHPLFRNSDVW